MKVKIENYITANEDKEIYAFYGMKATCPADIEQAIEGAAGEALDVEIGTCYGGDIFAGSEIYSSLKGYTGGVNIKVTGLAASAASIIAMSGHCEMAPTAMLMVHNVQSYAIGDYRDMDKESEILQTANKALAAAYTLKSGMDEQAALAMMDNETWMTAQNALDAGLVDGILYNESGIRMAASAFGMGLPIEVINKTREMLKAQKEPPADIEPPDNLATETDKMKLALQLEL